jgi:hypothetical protein
VARDLELHLDCRGAAGVERGKRQPRRRRRRAERPPQAEAGAVGWRARGRSHVCHLVGDREVFLDGDGDGDGDDRWPRGGGASWTRCI